MSLDMKDLLEEKLGHELPISYEDWIECNHYGQLPEKEAKFLYQQEMGFVESVKDLTIGEIAAQRIQEFTTALRKYMI